MVMTIAYSAYHSGDMEIVQEWYLRLERMERECPALSVVMRDSLQDGEISKKEYYEIRRKWIKLRENCEIPNYLDAKVEGMVSEYPELAVTVKQKRADGIISEAEYRDITDEYYSPIAIKTRLGRAKNRD